MVKCMTKAYDRPCKLNGCGNVCKRYIYGLFDIRLWVIFYIGHSVNPWRRYHEHIEGAWPPFPAHTNYDKDLYIFHLLEAGIEPLLLILDSIETDCREEAEQLEIAYIEMFRQAGYLITGWEGEGSSFGRHSYVNEYLKQIEITEHLKGMYREEC